MKTTILSLLLFLIASHTFAREASRYPISEIPEALRKDAHAVIREDAMTFTIQSASTALLHVHLVVTIFNANARHFATQAIGYDKLQKISSLKAQAIDANGFVIKKLKNKEITDHSAFEGMFSDNRMKVADLTQARYPYTVEFEYEIAYKFLYHIAGSTINAYEHVPVQHASYQLNFPEKLAPRYKTYNVEQAPERTNNGDIISLTWSFDNLPPPTFEPYADRTEAMIRIEAAPTVFEFEGYAGTMESWDEYGKWIASLNRGRNVLPEETRAKIKALASPFQTREDKVKALYNYLQNNTRYVSIQLGIGGYQPFEAAVVDKTGYGDCKALSNYMLALLETVGIKGYYTLVLAGEGEPDLDVSFPSSQFNHVIVAVPNGADTLWLECTSQTTPAGYQGRFTGDRKGLLITDNGASIVNTTRYPAEANTQFTSAEIKVDQKGSATAHVIRSYSGLQYENGNLNFVVTRQYDDQKKWLQQAIGIPSFDITSFSMTNVKDKLPTAVVTADLAINKFATVSGNRMFMTPNLMNRSTFVPQKVGDRKQAVERTFAYIDVDTIRYHLPEGIAPEFIPPNVLLESVFGSYEATYSIDEAGLLYVRRIRMNKGTFPASSYEDLIDFYRNISKADNTKMVFKSKT